MGSEKSDRPLEVHLYRDMSSYAAAERQITGGQFRNTGAFSAYSTRAAYVALQPACEPIADCDRYDSLRRKTDGTFRRDRRDGKAEALRNESSV